ncbi:chemotaxis protein CheC [Desulfuribacillus stibiiarsenatis]|uniref:Chemotaxis protein CheC n=1 Tax=Desulfuribacillus stibiiarsenatis TaxID=1390249 RepID=A0A1E5L7S0_9FIRM|nr:chemotaxis protein CheX [Desulfuribacillus stibiiarsenatis]OEH86207.1 chemotaxis protein CheC [Desulfuribacillus stibiiarsenatis]
MKAEYINPFYTATNDVFRMMLDLDVQRGKIGLVEEMVSSKEANVLLGVTGDLKGSILFSFPKDMILEMVRIMCGMKMQEIDSFVSSALGEIANIVGGNAITNLTSLGYTCDIVPPQIFVGQYRSLSMASQKSLQLTMVTSIGEFELNIFLKER